MAEINPPPVARQPDDRLLCGQVSRELAASEAAAPAAAVAQRQPVAVAAGAGSRSIPPRPTPPESPRQPARGEPSCRTSVSSRVEGLKYAATLEKGAIAKANVEWGIPVPARWRNIGGDGIPGRSRKILILQPLGASSSGDAILFLSGMRRTDRSRRDGVRRRLCACRADRPCGGPGAAGGLGVGTVQADGGGCQHQARRTDRGRAQVGRR